MFVRIAFLKLCCPGDILFTTPTIRAVKTHYPESGLFYLTGSYSSFVPEHNPHIERTFIVPPPFEMTRMLKSARSFWKGITTVAQNDFDLVISFHRSKGVAAMARLGHAKRVLSFDTASPFANQSVRFESDKHEVLRYLDIASLFNVNPAGLDLEYQTTPFEDDEAEKILFTHGISAPFIAIAPGGGENPGTRMHIKRWPTSRFKEVASYFYKRGFQTIAIGSKSETELGNIICADANLTGKTSFPQLAAILKRAALVIANDSGPLYLASAVGSRTIGIYGPSSPKLVGPFSKNHRSVVNPVNCHPCYHPEKNIRGVIECPMQHWACMLTLPVKDITEAADKLLTAA
jgi:ADP-heptose:LPS heptosyltransferase